MGAGVAGAFICTMKFLADNFEGERFATLSGITSLIGNAGGMTAQAPLAMLVAALTWRWSFVLLGVVSLLLSLLCFLVLPRSGRRPFHFPCWERTQMSSPQRACIPSLELPCEPGLLPCPVRHVGDFIPEGRSPDRRGALMTLMAGGVMAGAVAAGKLSDRWGSRKKPLCLFALAHFFLWGLLVFLSQPLSPARPCRPSRRARLSSPERWSFRVSGQGTEPSESHGPVHSRDEIPRPSSPWRFSHPPWAGL